MAVLSAPRGRQARSAAADDLIMGTNSSSIVSKRSVERLYFPNETHFFRHFVSKPQRRSPLINRGYWLRLRAIDVVVRRFVSRSSTQKKVVINLGCGSDVLPWQCYANYGLASEGVLFIDVDFPDLIIKKRDVVLQTPPLRELLGDAFQTGDSDQDRVVLRSERYCQVGCDLRQLDELRKALDTVVPLSGCQLLFVAEVSITYMDTPSADSLLQWASSIGQAEFCLLEHIIPHGADHPFAETMLRHLKKLNAPPKSVHTYPTTDAQRARFQSRGWPQVHVWDLWEVWTSDAFLTSAERSSLDEVEPFDEWEDFVLFARHYCLVHASTLPVDGRVPPPSSLPSRPRGAQAQPKLEVTCHQRNAPRRRFGDAMVVSDSWERLSAVHMLGLGTNGRAASVDVYSLEGPGGRINLPLSGPPTRMCYTLTDLGQYGVLLVGGRGSPSSAFSDCFLFQKGAECCWRPTWSLPISLFRHSAIRLKGSSLALVVGGKTDQSTISQECFVFDPERGWHRCQVTGDRPRPAFGVILCQPGRSANTKGDFDGLLAGGIGEDGRIVTQKYAWNLKMSGNQFVIDFRMVAPLLDPDNGDALSLFGARCVQLDGCTVLCGGLGQDAQFLGRDLVAVSVGDDGSYAASALRFPEAAERVPFMVGCSVVPHWDGIVVLGGGATCFSMGTFWETGIYSVSIPHLPKSSKERSLSGQPSGVEFVESRILDTGCASNSSLSVPPAGKAVVTAVPRIRLGAEKSFDDILSDGMPVIIEGMDLGECQRQWTCDYMVERVGGTREVVVHECDEDTDKMDFNSKNFRYVKDSFANVMTRIQAGGRLYLRSLSLSKPSEEPANIERDFPALAEDFRLPPELNHVRDNLFSSVLRVSGRVNMWLHYDVMANVYAQIIGHKRIILFPPRDVAHLALGPGMSTSSLDVFPALESPRLAATHPHEAVLGPGDVLFLPALWPHASAPSSPMGVAVNVFFRDRGGGYAPGRDVYGNRDLAAYDQGRAAVARLASSFRQFPLATRQFYLTRIADELRQAAEGT